MKVSFFEPIRTAEQGSKLIMTIDADPEENINACRHLLEFISTDLTSIIKQGHFSFTYTTKKNGIVAEACHEVRLLTEPEGVNE